MKEHRHYRIVVKEVGKPIYEFSNGKQLVKILSDCVLGAYSQVTHVCDLPDAHSA